METAGPELLNLLKDPTVDVRLEAVRRFSQLSVFPAELFVVALGDADWRVRKEAVTQFMRFPEAASRVVYLVEQLAHPDNAGLRNAAIEILVGLGATAIPELIKLLATANAEVRKFIVDILGEIGLSSCISELLPYLQDADDNVRYAVVETCGKLKADEAVSALLDLLETADTGLRFTIFEALAAIGVGVPVARIVPYSDDRLLRKAVFSCLGALGDVQALPVLVAGTADPLRKTREVALTAIGEVIKGLPAEVSLPPVVAVQSDFSSLIKEYLEHKDPVLRRAACYALCLQPGRELVRKLLPLLEEDELCSDAIAVCWRMPLELLLELVNEIDVSDEMAQYLIFLFGELRCQAIIPQAIAGLSAESPELRYVSALTLGKLAVTETIPRLGDTLLDPVAEVREAAAESLQLFGSVAAQAVLATLAPYLESDDAGLRLLAVRTLASLPAEKVEDTLLLALKDVAAEVRCEALRSLKGGVSRRLLSGLALALTDEDADVRRLAAEAMAVFPSHQVLPILTHAIDDPDPWVRMAAIRAVPGGAAEEVEALVQKGLADAADPVVMAALETAVRLLPERSEAYLLSALDNPDQEVVATAVRLLLVADWGKKLLAHTSARVRLAAVRGIEQSGVDWTGLFEDCLASEPDAEVRVAFEAALRRGRTKV